MLSLKTLWGARRLKDCCVCQQISAWGGCVEDKRLNPREKERGLSGWFGFSWLDKGAVTMMPLKDTLLLVWLLVSCLVSLNPRFSCPQRKGDKSMRLNHSSGAGRTIKGVDISLWCQYNSSQSNLWNFRVEWAFSVDETWLYSFLAAAVNVCLPLPAKRLQRLNEEMSLKHKCNTFYDISESYCMHHFFISCVQDL